jgi:hypothetical protein
LTTSAQARGRRLNGWGLYFASRREVSESYKEMLSEDTYPVDVEKKEKSAGQLGDARKSGHTSPIADSFNERLARLPEFVNGKSSADEAIEFADVLKDVSLSEDGIKMGQCESYNQKVRFASIVRKGKGHSIYNGERDG